MRARNARLFGKKGGYKKAIVSLEPGHTIDIFGDI
jgi:ribosomal protein L23